MSIAITLPTVLTCPVCGRSDESRPVFQVWDEGRGFVTRRDDAREWTEEVLSPLALRIAPPAPPPRRWLLVAAGASLVMAVGGVPDQAWWGLIAAPVLMVAYALGRVRGEAKS